MADASSLRLLMEAVGYSGAKVTGRMVPTKSVSVRYLINQEDMIMSHDTVGACMLCSTLKLALTDSTYLPATETHRLLALVTNLLACSLTYLLLTYSLVPTPLSHHKTTQLMCRWMMKAENGVVSGALCDLVTEGMMYCRFSPTDKLLSVELIFDVMSVMQQLQVGQSLSRSGDR